MIKFKEGDKLLDRSGNVNYIRAIDVHTAYMEKISMHKGLEFYYRYKVPLDDLYRDYRLFTLVEFNDDLLVVAGFKEE